MGIQKKFTIAVNKKVCGRFYRMQIDARSLAQKIRPGQFVHIRVGDGLEPFFRRPFSVHRARKNIEILYEVVGRGTEALSQKKKGETLDILGPLGNSFRMPGQGVRHVVMIAGGVGVAPFLILTDALKKKKCDMILLYGGRTKGHVFSMKEFRQNGCRVHIATDDGSAGVKGRVSKLFPEIPKDKTMIYACGPRPMMATVQKFAREHSLEGQASCEEVMACGLGACLGCVIQTRQGFRTVCKDGPIFELQDIVL